MTPHPSFLELDRFALSMGADATRQHVGQCPECQAYVASVRVDVPVPHWVREAAVGRRPPSRWRVFALAGSLAFASVTAAVVYTGGRGLPISTEKAEGPSLALYVKRDDRVFRWTGAQRVVPGDLLRLELAPSGLSHVRVTDGAGQTLYEGDVAPTGTAFLPVSWKVDDAPGPEILEVTLTRPNATPWSRRLTVDKAARR